MRHGLGFFWRNSFVGEGFFALRALGIPLLNLFKPGIDFLKTELLFR